MSKSENRREVAKRLLQNEREFGKLFSEMEKYDSLFLFHNRTFAEDPVFNHFALNDSILDDELTTEIALKQVVKELKRLSSSLGFRTTVFSENLWRKTLQFEKIAISEGFRVIEKMEVLSKSLEQNNVMIAKSGMKVDVTKDYEAWNRIFVSSYAIPPSWNDELLKRERNFLQNESVNLLLAREESSEEVLGCLLCYLSPPGLMGIYCVGTEPRARHRGVAHSMMRFAEERARTAGCNRMTLQTLNSDGVAPMYKKMGYATEFERSILWHPISG